ncbi:MAG: type II toxin-antitoxin system HicB family antitoxin [Deltaproteobacteria bacterium]|nr:type II toxin-antitoxin system HicB family antitoxin [Deltaproteobacteria bacterium]
MKLVYPIDLIKQDDGSFLVCFPDIPEALTDGETKDEALSEAVDCLIAALGGYINDRRDIPVPSLPKPGQEAIIVPPLVSAKLALYQAMRETQITRVALGKRIGVSEGAVRRLLDLDHKSHIGQIDAALSLLGKRLVVEVQDAA